MLHETNPTTKRNAIYCGKRLTSRKIFRALKLDKTRYQSQLAR